MMFKIRMKIPLFLMLLYPIVLYAGAPLAGIWEINCIPNAAPPFQNVTLITDTGQIINLDPVAGSSVGKSYRMGPSTFVAGFHGYINDGVQILRYEVQASIEVIDDDNITGVFKTFVRNIDGTDLFDYTGSLTGQRLSVTPYLP